MGRFLHDKGEDGCPKPCESEVPEKSKCQDVKPNDAGKCAEKIKDQMATDRSSGNDVAQFVHYQRNIWWNQNGVGDCPAPCTTAAEEGVRNSQVDGGNHAQEQSSECQDVKPDDGSECANKIEELMGVDKWSGKEVAAFADYQRNLWKDGEASCPRLC